MQIIKRAVFSILLFFDIIKTNLFRNSHRLKKLRRKDSTKIKNKKPYARNKNSRKNIYVCSYTHAEKCLFWQYMQIKTSIHCIDLHHCYTSKQTWLENEISSNVLIRTTCIQLGVNSGPKITSTFLALKLSGPFLYENAGLNSLHPKDLFKPSGQTHYYTKFFCPTISHHQSSLPWPTRCTIPRIPSCTSNFIPVCFLHESHSLIDIFFSFQGPRKPQFSFCSPFWALASANPIFFPIFSPFHRFSSSVFSLYLRSSAPLIIQWGTVALGAAQMMLLRKIMPEVEILTQKPEKMLQHHLGLHLLQPLLIIPQSPWSKLQQDRY